jgi:6-pyruvoyltetrahydropterin/6-carboxytetrahydropterin synthase
LISLTRRYRFPAAHVLRRDDYTEAENARVYGKCANPNGHGHDYVLEITVGGRIDPECGTILPAERFDAVVREHLVERVAHTMLNDDPLFAEVVPTAENVARTAHALLRAPLRAAGAELRRIRVRETRNNTFDCGDLR